MSSAEVSVCLSYRDRRRAARWRHKFEHFTYFSSIPIKSADLMSGLELLFCFLRWFGCEIQVSVVDRFSLGWKSFCPLPPGSCWDCRTLRNANFCCLLGGRNPLKTNIDYARADGQNGFHSACWVCVDRRGIVFLQQGAVLGPRSFALCSVYLAWATGLGAGPTRVNQTNKLQVHL